MAVKLNSSENIERIIIIVDKEQYPIAYRNKIEELVEQKCYDELSFTAIVFNVLFVKL